MKIFKYEIEGYTAQEIYEQFPEAFNNVKQFYFDAFRESRFFSYIVEDELKIMFPDSELTINYSLSYCQGDGFNIEGEINLYDFINVWNATEKEKRAINFYLDTYVAETRYTFEANRHYGYSCKFIDRKYIDDVINEFITDCEYWFASGIKKDLISRFFNDLISHFEELDKHYKEFGYGFFYEAENDEIFEDCDTNDYYFTKEGKLI